MENITETNSKKFDRVKLPFEFDVNALQRDVGALAQRNFIYYSVIPLRAPAHQVDASIPFPPPAEDYADGTWTDWLDTEELTQSPALLSVVDFFRQNTTVNLVRLLRLEPGAIVKEHTDPTLALEEEKSMIRLTIPIFNNDQVEFILNDELVPMKPGECWYLKLNDPHRVNNLGTEERINLTIDVIPNDWIRDVISKSV
ncbi:aspartyl/asparaginyl beta-hydroxylase domain-containing protein [Algoriphagus sp. PAP.12]|uniref:aspartyl/asparaginyl beta-hydroxylase domain-containing protein n=1 Tax=Algoriphagus sp. PAP.12 TaxID=2996678 RepID=UPI00227D4F1D|nr:aspartyl/asparaginyl beta-hydroxylase domain-containing protein [Algoriphagus sp. PAP.12]